MNAIEKVLLRRLARWGAKFSRHIFIKVIEEQAEDVFDDCDDEDFDDVAAFGWFSGVIITRDEDGDGYLVGRVILDDKCRELFYPSATLHPNDPAFLAKLDKAVRRQIFQQLDHYREWAISRSGEDEEWT